MKLDKDAAMVWVGGLPNIIFALGVFTTMPYGVSKAGQTMMEIWKKRDDKGLNGGDSSSGSDQTH